MVVYTFIGALPLQMAPSMSFPGMDVLNALFVNEDAPCSHSCVGVRVIMRSSNEDRFARDLNCVAHIAPIFLPILTMRGARIFSNFFLGTRGVRLGVGSWDLLFLSFLVSVWACTLLLSRPGVFSVIPRVREMCWEQLRDSTFCCPYHLV